MDKINKQLENNLNNIQHMSIHMMYKQLFHACKVIIRHYQQFAHKLQFIYAQKQHNQVPKKLKTQPGQTLKRTYQNKILQELRSIHNSPHNQYIAPDINADRDEIAQQLSQQLEDGMRFQQVDNPRSNFLSKLSQDLQISNGEDELNPILQHPVIYQPQVTEQNAIINNLNDLQSIQATQQVEQPSMPNKLKQKRVPKKKVLNLNIITDEMNENSQQHTKKSQIIHQLGYQINDQFIQIIKDSEKITLSSSIIRGATESFRSLHTLEGLPQQDNEIVNINLNDSQLQNFNFQEQNDIFNAQMRDIQWENSQTKQITYNKNIQEIIEFTQALQLLTLNKCKLFQQSNYSVLLQPIEAENQL